MTVKDTPISRSGLLLVASGAVLWGTIGLFFKIGLDYGLSPLSLAALRATLTLALLILGLGLTQPHLLRIRRGDLPAFLLFGGVSVALFYWVYILAVDLTSVATAAVLLYTAPAWVTVLAWRLFGEPLGRRKLLALALAVVGCALVARAYDPAALRINGLGVLAGLAAGLTYALYSILGVPLLRHYTSWTVVTGGVAFGALLLFAPALLQGPIAWAPLLTPSPLWGWLFGLALGPTVGALLLYTAGLQRVPASVASITATIEPIVALALAVIVLGERLEAGQMAGAGLILAAVALLSVRRSA